MKPKFRITRIYSREREKNEEVKREVAELLVDDDGWLDAIVATGAMKMVERAAHRTYK